MIKHDSAPIGLFDSGIGGLTVLKALRDILPNRRYIYLGDTARTPYGSKSESAVRRYAQECANFLKDCGVETIVAACNTASAAALPILEKESGCPVVGTIAPIVKKALETNPRKILVLGTEATIRSRAYEKNILDANPSIKVWSKACPLFVPLVEEGFWGGKIIEEALSIYLSEYRQMEPDAVILGCTHYPLLKPVISEYFGPRTMIIESGEAVAQAVADLHRGAEGGSGSVEFYLTDPSSKFKDLAKALLNEEVFPRQVYISEQGLSRDCA